MSSLAEIGLLAPNSLLLFAGDGTGDGVGAGDGTGDDVGADYGAGDV